MRAYIAERLTGVDPRMEPDAVAGHLAGETSMTGGSPFLLARLVADQLRSAPVDTSQPGWQDEVSHSIEDAFDADLAQVRAPGRPEMAAARSPAESARLLLAALTWGFGAGLPEEEWLACANADGHGGLGSDDVSWVLDELGRYIIQDGEAGVAVYRIAHQSLADHVRPPFVATYQQIFDPQAQPVAAALLGRYAMLLANGVPVTDPGYLWRYTWRHAAAAGAAGLGLIRGLTADDSQLLPDVAAAAGEVANHLSHWGYVLDALAPAQEAAELFRQVADTDSTFVSDLANALNDLGAHYSSVGRPNEAVTTAEEAVLLYRDLADANPAFVFELAGALSNLGVHYSRVGRLGDAITTTEEAVGLRRELAEANPAVVGDLSVSLNNLSIRHFSVGRLSDAIITAEEAVRLCRDLAETTPTILPHLAKGLTNLGPYYGSVGRYYEAIGPSEEAVQLNRELAETNPAFIPELADALTNLGTCYREVGRHHEAVAVTEEAIRLRRSLAENNPALIPYLAHALNNLATHYGSVGRHHEAIRPSEEAVQLRRELAETNPAHIRDLAGGLTNLGDHYGSVGRHHEAVSPSEEAVQLYRELAETNPAHIPELADALTNLGIRYREVGRHHEAVAVTEEAIQVRRELAETNTALLPHLANALTNLGIHYGSVGRHQEAISPSEEAVQLRRELAETNPAFIRELADALTNLGACYREVGRHHEAVAVTEEAIQVRRELAETNTALLPHLANALTNLGVHYGSVGRHQEAISPSEEAVQLYRELAEDDPAHIPGLADALINLGACYWEVERHHEAISPSEEAVEIYQELADINPAFVRDLVRALNNLDDRCGEAGVSDRVDAGWDEAIAKAEPPAAAFLLVARARRVKVGHSGAAEWLARALALDRGERMLVITVHEQARRHRGSDPAAFDKNWARHTGESVPAWLTVDLVLLSSARAWVATDTYTAERDYLIAHPELLEAAADTAVAEALLAVSEHEAARYTALRQAAQHDGADAAYRPLLLAILAREFASADPGRQRALLADRRDELLTSTVTGALSELATQEDQQAIMAQRAAALLDLARSGDAEPVLAALTEPGQFPRLLHGLALRLDGGSVGAAAIVAYTAATTRAEAATAVFYLAVGVAAGGDQEQADDLITQALAADPAQVPGWINALAEIGEHHHGVLQLIPVLTAPAEQPAPSELSPGDT